MVGVLFPGQFRQVLKGKLAVDLGLVIPAPSRYHVRVTAARMNRLGSSDVGR
jgi:hypothetical protein